MIKYAALVAAFLAGWYVNGLRYEKIIDDEVIASQANYDELRNELEAAELRAAQIKVKTVTNEVIRYVKTTDRTVCDYDADRVRIKADILKAADPRSVSTD